jgi:putative transposase
VPSGPRARLVAMANVCLVAPAKLLVRGQDSQTLRETLERADAARCWIAERGHTERRFGRSALHRLTYYEAREQFGLSAQMVVRAIGSVLECFSRDRRTVPRFRPHASLPHDNRILAIHPDRSEVSLWTLRGRLSIPFASGEHQKRLIDRAVRFGECDLRRLPDGRWMLDITVEVEAPDPYAPGGWLGVDLGIVNIATDSDGHRAAGGHLTGRRRHHRRMRVRLQKKGTWSARRRLTHRSGRECRFPPTSTT